MQEICVWHPCKPVITGLMLVLSRSIPSFVASIINGQFLMALENILLLFLVCDLQCSLHGQGQYEKLIIEESGPDLHSEFFRAKVKSNCDVLTSETSWNGDLYRCNTDQCSLYENYLDFSRSHLSWIDEVKIGQAYDADAGMEVETVHFYSEGKEVAPQSFLSARIERCKGPTERESIGSCAEYMVELAKESRNLMDRGKAIQKSFAEVFRKLPQNLEGEAGNISEFKNPLAIKKMKNKRDHAKSVQMSSENSSVLLPEILKSIMDDYAKLSAVSKTLNKLEKGL